MATSQMLRPEEKTGTWASMFPVEQVSEQQSALFTKKLLAVAISNITYLRAIFPERAYGDRRLGDLNLKILRDDSACPGASQIIKWVKGCFDALDKKYLRMLLMGIYVDPDDPQTVIESYAFKFSYSTQCGVDIYRSTVHSHILITEMGKKISSCHGTEQTKKETIQLLRTLIILTQNLQSLPDNVMMTMKILYYDEVTPADYEPPGFKASSFDSFHFEDEPVNIKIGDVSTPFHGLKMLIKTDKKQFDLTDDGAEDTTSGQPISNSGLDIEQEGLSQQGAEDSTVGQPISNSELDIEQEGQPQKHGAKDTQDYADTTTTAPASQLHEATVPGGSPAKPEVGKMTTSTEKSSKEDEFSVSCPCGCNEDDGLMIVCDVCSQWQHAVCFCILDEEHAPEEHVCDFCAKADSSRKPTDPYLKDLNTIAVQATCLWRRTLTVVVEFSRLLPHHLASRLGVDTNVAQGLVKRLEKEGFVLTPNKDKRLGKVVLKNKVEKEGIPAYFRPPKKTDEHSKENCPIQKETIPMDIAETDLEIPNTNADNRQERKKLDNNKFADEQTKLSDVTEKTANISLHSHQLRSSSAKKKAGLSVLKTKQNDTDNASNANRENSKKRGQKRVFSKVDQTEFELSNSQETPSTRSTRRRKCSDVHKSILV